MAQFVVPTIFTAVNNYSTQVAAMSRDTATFSTRLNSLNDRVNTVFGSIGGRVKGAAKQLLAYGEAALLIEGTMASGKAITEYQDEIANLSAVTGASGAKLDLFKSKITEVGRATKKSSVEVAQAFTNVDNNMPQFHEDAAALAEVTKESIILAKAGRMELGPSAESLTLSMNQFGLGANYAKTAIDALAGGAVAGSSKISETSEALQVFGSVAANVAKVTYAESVAIVEMASKFEKGAEAGTRIRNILLDMTNVKFGPAAKEVRALGVDLDKVSNRDLPFIDRFTELSKIKDNPQAMEKLFEKRNVALASGLFSVMGNYNKVLASTSKVGTAEKMAATNTDTLSESVKQLGAAWVTEITTSSGAGVGLTVLTGTVRFLTDHLDGLMTIAEIGIGIFGVWKTVVWGTKAAMFGYNVVTGIAAGLTSNLTIALSENTVAAKAETAALFVMKAGFANVLGVVGLATVAVLAIASAFSIANDKAEFFANGLKTTKDGIEQLQAPITQQTQALLQYNKAMTEYREKQAQQAFDIYERAHHPYKTFFSELIPFTKGKAAKEAAIPIPQLSDFGDTTGAQKQYLPDYTPGQAQTSDSSNHSPVVVNVYTHVDKNGNVTTTQDKNGSPIPVSYGSTVKGR